MGAYDFTTYATGKNVEDAFANARCDAQWEHGHGGYTGTIAEKNEFTIIQEEPLPEDAARALIDQLMAKSDERIADKWGPAGAVPVAGASGTVIGWLFFGWASS